ncbi:MAG: hypothetical protein ABJF23_15945 [Bryobacteraceae bacterium]
MSNLKTKGVKVEAGCGPGHNISIFLPGTQAHGEPDPLRLKSLLQEAERKLSVRGCRPRAIRDLLAPVYELQRRPELWLHQAKGLALFRSDNLLRYHSAPADVPELVVVQDTFYLDPVFLFAETIQRFLLLALSESKARLLEANAGTLTEIPGMLLPGNISAGEGEAGESGHPTGSVRPRWTTMLRRRPDLNQALLTWFRKLDRALVSRLEAERAPLILIGVPHLCHMFRNVSRSPQLLAGEIHGSPEAVTGKEIWQRCREIATEHFQARRQKTADEYLRLWHTQRASNDLHDIDAAARQGRVEALFLGVLDPSSAAEARLRSSNVPLNLNQDAADAQTLNLATLNTFMSGGTIYAVAPDQVPGRGSVAAVFRY